MQTKRPSHGTKLLNEWLDSKNMILVNDKAVEKVFTDHFTIKLELKIPMKMFRKGKKRTSWG